MLDYFCILWIVNKEPVENVLRKQIYIHYRVIESVMWSQNRRAYHLQYANIRESGWSL